MARESKGLGGERDAPCSSLQPALHPSVPIKFHFPINQDALNTGSPWPHRCRPHSSLFLHTRTYTRHFRTTHTHTHTCAQFIDCLDSELSRVEADKAAFVERFGEPGYSAVVDGWNDKLARARAGEQRWGLFVATKPLQ